LVRVDTGNAILDIPYVAAEAWVRPALPLSGDKVILDKAGAYTLTQVGDKIRFDITAANGTCTVTSTNAVTAGAFAHVQGAYDGSGVSVLLDSLRTDAPCTKGAIVPTLGGVFSVGAAANGATPYDGILDEVRLWGNPPTGATNYSGAYGTKLAPGRTCKDILTHNPYAQDGTYWIDPDGSGGISPLRAVCDMTRNGGGWTMGLKMWYYAQGTFGNANAQGAPEDALDRRGSPYKLSDAVINAVIGSSHNFDVLADQAGHNSGYSAGNNEFVVLSNYTGTWTFAALMPESTSTTTMRSYRSQDEALAWEGRLACGTTGGAHPSGKGINCNNVVSGNNPAGGSGCTINMGTSTSASWHLFYTAEHNADTYLYICNGAQHSSSYDVNHRFWFRERS